MRGSLLLRISRMPNYWPISSLKSVERTRIRRELAVSQYL